MNSFLARSSFFVRTLLEKTVLMALGYRWRHYAPVLQPHSVEPLPPSSSFLDKLQDVDENSTPYVFPEVAENLRQQIPPRFLEQDAQILFFNHTLSSGNTPPFLKPEWSPELWMNVDILYGAAYQTAYLKQIAAQSKERLLARAVLQARKVLRVPNVYLRTVVYPWQDETLRCSHSQTVQDYLDLLKVPLPAIEQRPNGSLRFRWPPAEKKVSIIIPNKDHPQLLKQCVNSIYANTNEEQFEILIVDDQSRDPILLAYYRQMQETKHNFRVLEGKSPFNFSRACNLGAKVARGELLLFLNNDTEVLDSDWLTNLIGPCTLPGVGAVGAKLVYPNGKVQHAGVVIGLEGHASHVFQGVSNDPFTPYGHVDWMRNVSAVTAACMLVPKERFWEVGGFDERFQIAFGDIDLCLRLSDAGYRIVYTPDSYLVHHEGKSRGKFIPAQDICAKAVYFLQKVAEGDPYYPPELSRAYRFPTLRWRWEQDPLQRLQTIVEVLGKAHLR